MAEKKWDDTNRGVLFNAVERKNGNEKRPDYKGQGNFAGEEFWISGWLRTSRKGEKFLSISFEPKKKVVTQGATGNGAALSADDADALNDSIPF